MTTTLDSKPWINEYQTRSWTTQASRTIIGNMPMIPCTYFEAYVAEGEAIKQYYRVNHGTESYRPFFYDLEQIAADIDPTYGCAGPFLLIQDWMGYPKGSIVFVSFKGMEHDLDNAFMTYLIAPPEKETSEWYLSATPWLNGYPVRNWSILEVSGDDYVAMPIFNLLGNYFKWIHAGSQEIRRYFENNWNVWDLPTFIPFFDDLEQELAGHPIFGTVCVGLLEKPWRGYEPMSLVMVTAEGLNTHSDKFTVYVVRPERKITQWYETNHKRQ